MENWIKYKELPSKKQLEVDFWNFVNKNPKFKDQMIKVGKSSLKKVKGFATSDKTLRYGSHDRYEILQAEHIFCEAPTEKIAFQIESMCQKITEENGRLIKLSDRGGGGQSITENRRFIVYVTIFKNDLFSCPIQPCSRISPHNYMIEHIQNDHPCANQTERGNQLLEALGIEKMDINYEPIPWSYESTLSTNCPACGKHFETRAETGVHYRHHCEQNINRREKEPCDLCGAMVCPIDMRRHIANLHNNADCLECDYCGKILTREGMVYHVKVHVGQHKIECNICHKMINYKKIDEHKKYQHTEETRPKKACPVCGKLATNLGTHMKMHEKEQCPTCLKYFTKQSIKAHIKTHTKKNEPKKVEPKVACETCGKMGTKTWLYSHKKTHLPRQKCKFCGKEYSADRMRKHIKIHQQPSTSKSNNK
ncbi:hypothetical protein PVAND_003059 [Polypedilum vanderplanki]|uniref:C2H2-type domain-containing protein n=1 Tax=Polypedilum vanderplanki TaxID=319348 RepID=A0A9J6BUK4_POLVA|nr:hypothetical protein PVAND_003059 [Polypedilum vanderplanki]